MAGLLRRANYTAHPIMQLPRELLAAVIAHLGIHERFTAACVCHRWRVVATSSPGVWADLSDFGPADSRLALALDRGKKVPIELGFELPAGASDGRISRLLRANLHRVVQLQISVGDWSAELSDALATPAPLLRQASICVQSTERFGPGLRADIFAGSARRLRALTLANVSPPAGSATPGFAHVESLRVSSKYAVPAESVLFLAASPNLRELELEVRREIHLDPRGGVAPACPSSSLQSLRVAHGSAAFIAMLPHAGCLRVLVGICDSATVRLFLQDLGADLQLVLEQNQDHAPTWSSCASVRARDGAGRERHADRWLHSQVSDVFTPHVAAHLTALVADARLWREPIRTRIALPSLASLELLLNVAAIGKRKERHLTDRLPLAFSAPKLETLRLRANLVERVRPNSMGWGMNESDAFMRVVAPLGPVEVYLYGVPELFPAVGCVVHVLPSAQ